MASKKDKIAPAETPKKGLTDNQRWVYGFMLLFFGLFVLVSIVSYFFYWAADQSVVRSGELFGESTGVILNNGGKAGAWLADVAVGRWFGVFAIAIPIVLIIFALRIMRFRPPVLRRSVRIALILMIVGSLMLGFFFDTAGNLYGSGLGGEHGIFVARWLTGLLGWAGTLLLLVCAGVLLAVYITRSTILFVNKVGKGLADSGAKATAAIGHQAVGLVGHVKPGRDRAGEQTDVRQQAEQQEEPQPQVVASVEPEPAFQVVRAGEDDSEPPFAVVEAGEGDLTTEWGEVAASVSIPADGPFEVVDAASAEEQDIALERTLDGVLGAGGVTLSDGTREGMEVLQAEHRDTEVDEERIDPALYDPTLELSKYQRPPVEILEDHHVEVRVTEEELRENNKRIVDTLRNFGIGIGGPVKATVGPTVTLYEIIPAPGVRISKIKNLEDDIALSLSALGIRIIAPMPGKGTIGIEVPNKDKEIVSMYSVVRSQKFQDSTFDLPVVLGKTIQNETFTIDLAKMPHLLVAGATGQGKSVGLNAIITSLLYKKHPAELKFVLVDPKKVELTLYEKLERHFLARIPDADESIITDTQKVIYTLNSLCMEMDSRYDLLRKAEVRHVKEYNDKFTNRKLNPNRGHRYLPYIVVVIDEFADMIMTAGREIETPIARIAQLARAVGIHLVIATQRPTTNIITGVIKANFPARIAFRVSSMIDSRTIIDGPGANQLIGRGDMLVSTGSDIVRVQCAFIDTPEIERITEFIGNQRGYGAPYELPEYVPEGEGGNKNVDMDNIDPMFDEVARFVVGNQQGSTSAIQRRFSIGYNRAGR
ncbi:MAG: DNA translocase FtsK, partial [Rikenellaceae bacterium]|nr:DNA translocase FtsK [Rikenellaceae bacterium]